jgi:hypothetical protein
MHQADDPRKVAEQYWQSLKNGDTVIARTMVSKSSQQAYDDYLALPPDERITIGEITLGDEQTSITTVLYPDSANREDNTAFETVLVMEDGQWKIDASKTYMPRPTPSDRELDELANELTESMQGNIDSIEEAMNEGLKMMDEALREGSRDLGESMLKGMEEMNRALQESINNLQQRREQQEQEKTTDGDAEGVI